MISAQYNIDSSLLNKRPHRTGGCIRLSGRQWSNAWCSKEIMALCDHADRFAIQSLVQNTRGGIEVNVYIFHTKSELAEVQEIEILYGDKEEEVDEVGQSGGASGGYLSRYPLSA